MSEPLSQKEFQSFVSHFDETMGAIANTLTDHTDRLDRIERLLWQGQRIEEIERRIRTLAERTGNPDLAVSMARPLV